MQLNKIVPLGITEVCSTMLPDISTDPMHTKCFMSNTQITTPDLTTLQHQKQEIIKTTLKSTLNISFALQVTQQCYSAWHSEWNTQSRISVFTKITSSY